MVVNSGAYREKYSELARAQADAVGDDNEQWVRAMIPTCQTHIAAWGATPLYPGAHETMKAIFREAGVSMKALRLNMDGSPSHPRRGGSYDTPLVPFDLS